MTKSNQSPFQLLQAIAQQANQVDVNLPTQNDTEGHWRGVGFQLAGNRFLASMEEVDEVLYMPSCTRFPGVKSWVIGVANIRGKLLSVIDLGVFFGEKPSVSSKRCRVLTFKQDDLYVGVVVDEVLGIQTLDIGERVDKVSIKDNYKSYVEGGYEQGQRSWTIFELSKLVQAPEFLQVAV